MPDELLVGGRGDQLRLTIAGVAACDGTGHVVQAFLQGVRLAVRVEAEFSGRADGPVITADRVIDGALSPNGFRPKRDKATLRAAARLVRQVGLLLFYEPWTGSNLLHEGGWRIGVTRFVRAYVDAPDLDAYWERRREMLARLVPVTPKDRSARQWACRTALVAWLFDIEAVESMTRAKAWDEFFLDARSMHEGVKFTDEDVDGCATWLHRHGLIDGVIVDRFNGPVLSYLTDRGIHCADRFGADIRGYVGAMEQPRQSGPNLQRQCHPRAVGVTSNLQARITQHKEKAVQSFTSRYNINKLVYYEIFSDAYSAISREKQIKGGSRQKKVELINSLNPMWNDLSETL